MHASLAGGTKSRAAVSFDIGRDTRVRLDTSREDKTEICTRLVVLWNMHEGIPTSVLESGAIRAFYDAVQPLVDALKYHEDLELRARGATVVAAWERITVEATDDGKRAHCDCSEAA